MVGPGLPGRNQTGAGGTAAQSPWQRNTASCPPPGSAPPVGTVASEPLSNTGSRLAVAGSRHRSRQLGKTVSGSQSEATLGTYARHRNSKLHLVEGPLSPLASHPPHAACGVDATPATKAGQASCRLCRILLGSALGRQQPQALGMRLSPCSPSETWPFRTRTRHMGLQPASLSARHEGATRLT